MNLKWIFFFHCISQSSRYFRKKIGLLKIDLTCSKVVSKTISLTSIKLKTENSSDIIGDSDSFVVSRIGGWTARTETKSGK